MSTCALLYVPRKLCSNNISSRLLFLPLHNMPVYQRGLFPRLAKVNNDLKDQVTLNTKNLFSYLPQLPMVLSGHADNFSFICRGFEISETLPLPQYIGGE